MANDPVHVMGNLLLAFFAGLAVTDDGGRDVDFIGSWIEYQF